MKLIIQIDWNYYLRMEHNNLNIDEVVKRYSTILIGQLLCIVEAGKKLNLCNDDD